MHGHILVQEISLSFTSSDSGTVQLQLHRSETSITKLHKVDSKKSTISEVFLSFLFFCLLGSPGAR